MKSVIEDFAINGQKFVSKTKTYAITHSRPVSAESLANSARAGEGIAIVSKCIYFWSNSRYATTSALRTALNRTGDMTIFFFNAASNMDKMKGDESFLPVFKNIDVQKILDEVGLGSREELISELGFLENSFDLTRSSILLGKLQLLDMIASALVEFDSGPHGLNQNKERTSTPTNQDLLDRVKSKNGNARWIGNTGHFGWSADAESIIQLTPKRGAKKKDVFIKSRWSSTTLPARLAMAGSFIDESGQESCVLSLQGFADKMHRNFREMNWHLAPDEFLENPTHSGPYLEDDVFKTDSVSHSDAWLSPNVQAQKQKLSDDSMIFFGSVFPHKSFWSMAETIGTQTNLYDADSRGIDHLWAYSVSKIATDLISQYGLASASVIESCVTSYLVVPDSACLLGTDETSPFFLDPIFSLKMIGDLSKDGPVKESFIDVHRHSHFPTWKRKDVAELVERSIKKLQLNLDSQDECNFLTKVLALRDHAETPNEFIQAEFGVVDWVSLWEHIKKEGTIYGFTGHLAHM